MKVSNKIIKENIKFLIVLVILFLVGNLMSLIIINKNSKPMDFESDTGISGLGLFISDKTNNIHNSIIDYKRMADYNYKFMNRTGNDLECSLSVFIDGKQISILNIETAQVDNSFKFFIEDNEDLDLPISLIVENLQEGAYSVDFSIVSNYDEYAIDNDADVWMTSTYNYTAAIDNGGSIFYNSEVANMMSVKEEIGEEQDVSQFVANFDKEKFINSEKPSNFIISKPDEIIEVPLVIGGSGTSNVLIYATLDNKQIKLNDLDNVVYKLSEGNMAEVGVKLKSPSQPGKYELLFYSVNNLINTQISECEQLKLSTSHRITLIVE